MTLEEFDKHVTEKLVPYVVSQYNTTTKVMATLEQLFSDLISAVGKTNAQEVLKKSRRIEFPYSTRPYSTNPAHKITYKEVEGWVPLYSYIHSIFFRIVCVFCVQYSRLDVKKRQKFFLNCGRGVEEGGAGRQCFPPKESK